MDWDLEAIVRGGTSEAPASTIMDDTNTSFSHFCSEQDELFCGFPEFSETTKVLDELEELYKPFYPVLYPLSTPTVITSSLLIPKEAEEVKVLKESEKVIPQDLQVPAVSKCKRSKKNKNRVVKQVTADSLCDAWAWRKYGQKPIKGSPYPRSYYKCSSSKGCLARKQVEKSHLDPGVFLITYTAEHSHPHPTRRNSLAGSTRKNNSIVASIPITRNQNTCSSSSPRTPSVVQSIADEVVIKSVQQSKVLKKEDDFFELLDEAEGAEFGDGWFPSKELFDQQLALDGFDFMDGFDDTLFVNESNALCSASL